MKIMPV